MLKSVFVFCVILFVNSASAEVIVCRGDVSDNPGFTVALQSVGPNASDVPEGTLVEYRMTIRKSRDTIVETVVLAQQEDVIFAWEAVTEKYGKISGHIYLDELEEASVRVESMDHGLELDCEHAQ